MAPTTDSRVKPVFIRTRDLPSTDDEQQITTREICGLAEKLVGYGTMEGAQQIGGLWRIYPKTHAARMQLLIDGLSLRNVHVRFHDENPFLVRNSATDGSRVETTKVFISNLPISLSNTEIENALANMKCQLVSKLVDECDRDEKGKLTRWKTGRRFIYIAVPTTPLPTQVAIGTFTARIYHREQKANRQPFCGNCLQTGHRKEECSTDVVCKRCMKPGHKSGERLCESISPPLKPRETTSQPEPESETSAADDSEKELSSSQEGNEIKAKKQLKRKKKQSSTSEQSNSEEDDRKTPERPAKVINTHTTPNSELNATAHTDTT